jgi:hypothetical protein
MPEQLFLFIQMEFPWALGPPDGRYLLRAHDGGEPEHVVVLGTLGARQAVAGRRASAGRGRRRLFDRSGSRRARAKATPEPAPVATARVTIVDPISVSAERQAHAWLHDLDAERDARAAVTVLNRLLHSHRIASANPYIHEVSPTQALVIRAGWGEGEQVADGRWLHARELPGAGRTDHRSAGRPGAKRRRPGAARTAALRPEERLAELLGARGASLLCEDLALRARLDLDQERPSLAAVELDRAFAAALPELRAEGRQDLSLRIAELEQLRAGVALAAAAAMPDSADTPKVEIVRFALERLEAVLRARTAGGFSLK